MTKKFQLLTLLAAFAAFSLSCKKEIQNTVPDSTVQAPDFSEGNNNPDEKVFNDAQSRGYFTSYIYTEGNEAGVNNIHMFKQHVDGHLTHEGMVASGGAGNAAALGSQGALAMSKNEKWLFAVNAGSNSVSSFKVHNNGGLTLKDTESSGGVTPVSLCVYHDLVYVVNAGSSSISGLRVGSGGMLSQIPNSNAHLSDANAGPAQISFSANGQYLYITEKMTNRITRFQVQMDGSVSNRMSWPSTGETPFGFAIAREKYMVVSNAGMGMPNASSVTSYKGINMGNLMAVNGAVENNQTAACWVALTKYQTFAYITNTGSNTISTYYVSPWGAIYLVHAETVSTESMPIDITVAPNNYYVFNLNAGAHSISSYHRAFLGDLIHDDSVGGLPPFAAGLVAW